MLRLGGVEHMDLNKLVNEYGLRARCSISRRLRVKSNWISAGSSVLGRSISTTRSCMSFEDTALSARRRLNKLLADRTLHTLRFLCKLFVSASARCRFCRRVVRLFQVLCSWYLLEGGTIVHTCRGAFAFSVCWRSFSTLRAYRRLIDRVVAVHAIEKVSSERLVGFLLCRLLCSECFRVV